MKKAPPDENYDQVKYRRALDAICARLVERGTNGLATMVGDRVVSLGRHVEDEVGGPVR